MNTLHVKTWKTAADRQCLEVERRMAALIDGSVVYFFDYDYEVFGRIEASPAPLPINLPSFVGVAYKLGKYSTWLPRHWPRDFRISGALVGAIRRDFGAYDAHQLVEDDIPDDKWVPAYAVEGDVPGDACISVRQLLDDEESGAHFDRYIAGDR